MSDKIFYVIPFSHSVRDVLRLTLIKKMSFVLKVINPSRYLKGGKLHPEYLKKSPEGTIPSFEYPDICKVGTKDYSYDYDDDHLSNKRVEKIKKVSETILI